MRTFHEFCIQVVRFEDEPMRIYKFRTDVGKNKALQRHAVVLEEAAEGKGKSAKDAHPTDFPGAQHVAQAKIHAHGNADGQQGEDELTERESEEQALLIVSDFFIDAYFYLFSPPYLFIAFGRQALAISAAVC